MEWYELKPNMKYLIIKFKHTFQDKRIPHIKLQKDFKIKIIAGQFQFYFWLNNYDVKIHSNPYSFI